MGNLGLGDASIVEVRIEPSDALVPVELCPVAVPGWSSIAVIVLIARSLLHPGLKHTYYVSAALWYPSP